MVHPEPCPMGVQALRPYEASDFLGPQIYSPSGVWKLLWYCIGRLALACPSADQTRRTDSRLFDLRRSATLSSVISQSPLTWKSQVCARRCCGCPSVVPQTAWYCLLLELFLFNYLLNAKHSPVCIELQC